MKKRLVAFLLHSICLFILYAVTYCFVFFKYKEEISPFLLVLSCYFLCLMEFEIMIMKMKHKDGQQADPEDVSNAIGSIRFKCRSVSIAVTFALVLVYENIPRLLSLLITLIGIYSSLMAIFVTIMEPAYRGNQQASQGDLKGMYKGE